MNFVDPIYDKKDIDRLRKAIKSGMNGERNLLLFEITLSTALRIGDVLDLKVSDVKTGRLKIKTSKTGQDIDLEFNDHVFNMIRSYITYKEDDDKLFKIDRVQAYRIFKKGADEVGLSNFGTHSIRKTKAYHYYKDSGHNISGTMELLGHKNSQTTLKYIGWTKKQLSDAVKGHVL